MDRRINLSNPPPDPHGPLLKQVAGLLQKLSYREMNDLVQIIRKNLDSSASAEEHAEALLLATDEILNTKAGALS